MQRFRADISEGRPQLPGCFPGTKAGEGDPQVAGPVGCPDEIPLQRAIRDRAAAATGFEAKRPARPTRLRRVIGDGVPGGVADDEAGELPPAARGAVFDNPKPGVRPGSLPRRG